MLLWRILLLVCSVIVGGCAGVRQVPLPESESSRFAGRTLQRTAYAKTHSGLYVQGARSGPLGGDPAALIGEGLLIGDRIVRAHAIDDPAIRIGQELARGLAERHGLRPLPSEPPVTEWDDMLALVHAYRDADVILDIRTGAWMITPLSVRTTDPRYRVVYSALLRLIDRERKEVLAEGLCVYQPEYADPNEAPTQKDLLGNNAEGLKRELATAADQCITFFRSNTFRL